MPDIKISKHMTSGDMPYSVPKGTFHRNAKILIGKRFGKLEVIEEFGRNSKRGVQWLCLCDCGNTAIRIATALISGRTMSCGCNKYSPEAKAKRGLTRKRPGAILREIYMATKRGAESRGLTFLLTIEEFEKLSVQDCFYCGDQPSQVKKSRFEECIVNGIDRMDNNMGYQLDNCVSCCRPCNFMKRDTPFSQFIDRCKNIASRSTGGHHSC